MKKGCTKHNTWCQCMLMPPCNAKEMKWWINLHLYSDQVSISESAKIQVRTLQSKLHYVRIACIVCIKHATWHRSIYKHCNSMFPLSFVPSCFMSFVSAGFSCEVRFFVFSARRRSRGVSAGTSTKDANDTNDSTRFWKRLEKRTAPFCNEKTVQTKSSRARIHDSCYSVPIPCRLGKQNHKIFILFIFFSSLVSFRLCCTLFVIFFFFQFSIFETCSIPQTSLYDGHVAMSMTVTCSILMHTTHIRVDGDNSSSFLQPGNYCKVVLFFASELNTRF